MRLIDADKIQWKSYPNDYGETNDDYVEKCDIDNMPTVDAVPVVHTRWAHLGGDEWCCPVCGFVITTDGSWDKPTKKYCEDCGAKMDGGDGDAKSV